MNTDKTHRKKYYYPFGMVMPNRSYSTGTYRFGFNGKENDNEVKGVGNSIDFGARVYDSRLGVFVSVDPMSDNFACQSTYIFAGNSPIKFIDKDGKFKISPSMADTHPLIYKYLSSQIESDVMSSSLLIQAYKNINPSITESNLSNTFKNNSGPVLYSISNPGGYSEAAGHHDYSPTESVIEINENIFNYVEEKLRGDISESEKQKALMYLFVEVNHEVAHEAVGFKGTDENGNDIKMSNSEYKQQQYVEPGNPLESEVWGIPEQKTEGKSDVIQGIKPGNAKNQIGVMDKAYEKANSTDEGKKTLPTVPKN